MKPTMRKLDWWATKIAAVLSLMAAAKSLRWVRLVQPTSTNSAPAADMTSGRRKEPPISINWPRETATGVGEEHQKERCGVVVDHDRGCRPTDGGDASGEWCQPLASPAFGDVVLQGKV